MTSPNKQEGGDPVADEMKTVDPDTMDKFLEHFGVKGMKWGVTRANNARRGADKAQGQADKAKVRAEDGAGKIGGGRKANIARSEQRVADRQSRYADRLEGKPRPPSARQQKKIDKAEYKDWRKDAMGAEKANKAFQDAAKTFEKPLKDINNDPMFKGKDLNAPENRRLKRVYDEATTEIFNQHLAQASINLTYNPKTERAVVYQFDRNAGMMKATEVKAQWED